MSKTTQADAVKIFKTRDSATTLLRKLGINARDYNFFIEKMTDGRFACKVAMAEMHLNELKQPKAKPTKQAAAKPAAKTAAPKREGISATARALILEGKTNTEVWEVLQAKFNLDQSKRHYPTWYRCEMKRTGLLPQDA